MMIIYGSRIIAHRIGETSRIDVDAPVDNIESTLHELDKHEVVAFGTYKTGREGEVGTFVIFDGNLSDFV